MTLPRAASCLSVVPRHGRRRGPGRSLLAAAALLALAGAPADPVRAQGAAPTPAAGYDLPQQPLEQALVSLARRASLQLLAPAELLRGRTARPVAGARDVPSALGQMLQGSGLRGRVDGSALIVEPAPAAESREGATLPVVRVTSAPTAESATGPVDGYRATRSQTATKTDTPLLDTPVSVQSVSRQLMDDQNVLTVKEAVANVSGVYANHGPDGNTMDAFVIRGFAVDSYGSSYLDGAKDFSRSPKETAGLERIEVLKGPAAIMYGRIEPGGMINRVAKRPQAERLTTVEQQVGTDRYFRTVVDSTGALDGEGRWLWRGVAVYEDADGFKDDTHTRRVYLSPQVEWRPDDRVSVRLGFEHMRDRRSWALGYGTIGDANGPVDIPVSTNLHGRDENYQDESNALKLDWSYRFAEGWTVQQRVTYVKRRSTAQGSGLSDAQVDGSYVRDYWGWERERSSILSTNLEVLGKLQTGAARHTLLAGIDWFDEDYDSGGWASGGTPTESNVNAPVRGDDLYRDDYTVMSFAYRNRNAGLYLQDQIALLDDRLHLLLGMRYDRSKHRYGFSDTRFDPVDKKPTWRAGVLYKLRPDLSTYASYVTGFGASQYDWVSGSLFEPQTSKQIELGLKYEPSRDLGLGVALFQLTKDNLTMADPDDPLRTILAGEARSRGIEFDASGRLTPNWEVAASYAYTDVRYTRSDSLQGERLVGVPKHGASLWTTYRFGAGWKVGGGLLARSSMLGTQRAWNPALYPYTLPGYTIFNAMAGYEFRLGGQAARLQVNVSNLTDKRYYPTTYGGTDRIGLGEPRKVIASLSVAF